MTVEIFLIRHTKVDLEEGTCYGFSDIELASSFPEELESIRKRLPQRENLLIFSSPLKRCKILAHELGSKGDIRFDDRLKEMNFGDWELKKWNEINRKEFFSWSKDFVNEIPPNGENYISLHQRTTEIFSEISRNENTRIAIVTHGGVIRSLLSHILSIPLEKSFHLQIDFGSVSKIKTSSKKIGIEYINR